MTRIETLARFLCFSNKVHPDALVVEGAQPINTDVGPLVLCSPSCSLPAWKYFEGRAGDILEFLDGLQET